MKEIEVVSLDFWRENYIFATLFCLLEEVKFSNHE
jgi:hypothetical protein